MAKTLRDIIYNDFEGFPRERLEFWQPEDLPVVEWTPAYDYNHVHRFSKGENFEEIALRTWLCTDTIVGLFAILWNGNLIAFTYQPARKSDKEWSFVSSDLERAMHEKFLSYADYDLSRVCKNVEAGDGIYDMEFDPEMKYDWETGPIW